MRRHPFIAPLLITVALVLVAAGCDARQAYPGDRLPRENVATISAGTSQMNTMVRIVEVDNTSLNMRLGSIAVLPGTHTVRAWLVQEPYLEATFMEDATEREVFARTNRTEAGATVNFDAVAGMSYTVLGSLKDDVATIWITEDTTGTTIATSSPEGHDQR